MVKPYVQQVRGKEIWEFLKHDHNGFILLTAIAQRARRTDEFNTLGLEPGEALVGDYKEIGLTRQEYRSSLQRLEKKYGIISIKATNKGTIARLINSDIYHINQEDGNQPATNQQPTSNQPATTNNNGKNEKNEKNEKELLTIPDFIDPNIWKAFKDHRRKMRLVMTPRAEQIIINKLIGFHENGDDPNASLDEAIEKSWRSVFSPKKEEPSEGDKIRRA